MAASDDAESADDRVYAKELGARLRAIRSQQGMSLQAVERKSDGKWKAVVIGSYERGDRSISVTRLADLSDFYGVPINELLPGGRTSPLRADESPRIVLDLTVLQSLDEDRGGPLRRFVSSIQVERGDFGNRIMSLRSDDLRALAIMYDRAADEFLELLIDWNLLTREHG
ncbi:MAG: transcriptional regulator [Pseudonocardiales bacterium]|nr:transcriptional regulator [Pseudonocardiales bacterium]